MLSGLAGQGVVTKLEMAVAKQRADLAKSEELQIRLEAERDKLARQVKIEDLRSRLDVRRLDLAILKDRPQDLRRLLTLKRQVEELDARIADLSRTVKQKAFHAPFDGSVLSVTATVGEVLRAGDAGLVVGDNGPLLFRGVAAPSQRTDIHPGQAVRVRIENYPYLTFGAASGKVEGLSTRLPLDAAAAFCVTCSIQSAPFRLETGLVAIADVVIFHGTVVKYLMHRYRPAGGA
jgi:membrane fusion protein